MSRRITGVLAAFMTAGAASLAGAAVAQASDATLRAIVRSDVPRIERSQAKIENGLATLQQTGSPKALLAAIAAQDRNFTALEKRLAPQRASSAKGRTGKADILTGLKLLVGSNRTIAVQLKRAATKKPVSQAALKSARRAAIAGNKDLAAGGQLLKA